LESDYTGGPWYQSEVLEEGVTIAGPVTPKLFVSTTGTDADWVVKLIDVWPASYPEPQAERRGSDPAAPSLALGGYQQLVRGNPLRGKFRNSFEKPAPFTPGKVEAVNFGIGQVNHTFRRGHRIMVQVQSSWFPLVDLNPRPSPTSQRRSRETSGRRPSACIARRARRRACRCWCCRGSVQHDVGWAAIPGQGRLRGLDAAHAFNHRVNSRE
jgi:predicted acyl esterase